MFNILTVEQLQPFGSAFTITVTARFWATLFSISKW